jgi:hypothetical protein
MASQNALNRLRKLQIAELQSAAARDEVLCERVQLAIGWPARREAREHECAAAWLRGEAAVLYQNAVGTRHGIEVHAQAPRQFAHRGELRANSKSPRIGVALNLAGDLQVHGQAQPRVEFEAWCVWGAAPGRGHIVLIVSLQGCPSSWRRMPASETQAGQLRDKKGPFIPHRLQLTQAALHGPSKAAARLRGRIINAIDKEHEWNSRQVHLR